MISVETQKVLDDFEAAINEATKGLGIRTKEQADEFLMWRDILQRGFLSRKQFPALVKFVSKLSEQST